MPRLGEVRISLLESLAERYGPLRPPGSGPGSFDGSKTNPFESIVAAAVELIADERTAASSFEVLRNSGLLDPAALASIDPLELDDLFRQARVKLTAKALSPLRKIAAWASEIDFDAETMANLSTEAIRDAWRALNGVGPATADALLLFGLDRPTFPVDRASYRILVRHGWLDPSTDYDEARSVLESIAPDNPAQLAQLSLAFEKLGRDACKPGTPRCDRCPLQAYLPENGPIEEN